MFLSLSVRIAEGFLSKEEAILSLAELVDLAVTAGYEGLCLRASQVGIHTPEDQRYEAAKRIRRAGLRVTMVTGDFDIVYNNARGPGALRRITPYLELARQFQAPLVRVALKSEADIEWARRAADQAAAVGVSLVHQCHTQSLFETVEGIERTLRAIDRPNFGLIYEPANLELCGQDYGDATIERLSPWIRNVYLQNQRIDSDGKLTLPTWCRGPVRFDLLQIHDPGGIDFPAVFSGLARVGYRGPVTVHQSASPGSTPSESAIQTSRYLRSCLHALDANGSGPIS